jgi:hypothetical protein
MIFCIILVHIAYSFSLNRKKFHKGWYNVCIYFVLNLVKQNSNKGRPIKSAQANNQ